MKAYQLYFTFLNDIFHKNMLKFGIKLRCCCFNDFISSDPYVKQQLNLFYLTNSHHDFDTLKLFFPCDNSIEFFYKDKRINIDINSKKVMIDDSVITIFLDDISLSNF